MHTSNRISHAQLKACEVRTRGGHIWPHPHGGRERPAWGGPEVAHMGAGVEVGEDAGVEAGVKAGSDVGVD